MRINNVRWVECHPTDKNETEFYAEVKDKYDIRIELVRYIKPKKGNPSGYVHVNIHAWKWLKQNKDWCKQYRAWSVVDTKLFTVPIEQLKRMALVQLNRLMDDMSVPGFRGDEE